MIYDKADIERMLVEFEELAKKWRQQTHDGSPEEAAEQSCADELIDKVAWLRSTL